VVGSPPVPGGSLLAKLLYKLGWFVARRRLLVLCIWVAVVAGVGALVLQIGTDTNDDVSLPGTGSQAAAELLADEFPPQQNGSSPIVFYAAQGKVTDSKGKQAIEASFGAIKKVPHVYSATDPFSQQGAAQISKDEKTAFISVLLDVGTSDLTAPEAQAVLDAADPGVKAGMQVPPAGRSATSCRYPRRSQAR
jgi:putative drug exporter of the RND superfamily